MKITINFADEVMDVCAKSRTQPVQLILIAEDFGLNLNFLMNISIPSSLHNFTGDGTHNNK